MKEKVKLYGSILIIVIFVPYLITVYLRGSLFGLSFTSEEDEQLEKQVVSELASEIPADYEMECLKAQAIIARTNLYRQMQADKKDDSEKAEESPIGDGTEKAGEGPTGDGTERTEEDPTGDGTEKAEEDPNAQPNPETGWTDDQMRAVWGDNYDQNLERLKEAVAETSGQILTFYHEPIQAAYHTACNAKTRNAAEVPGQEEYVYLVSVDSRDDIRADGFLYIGYREKAELAQALQNLFPNETIDPETLPDALQMVERDQADYVTKVQYGDTIVNGEAVRTELDLQSACFYLSELEGKIRIVTKGIGHGLGFSQYGAQQLAGQGYHCEDLLHYYYNDVEIEYIDPKH